MPFEKVSFEQYSADVNSNLDLQRPLSPKELREEYDSIELPKRGTKHSAGYDFVCPNDITMYPGESAVVCTGIRAIMPYSAYLAIHIRSGIGFKYGVRLANCTGIIDSDYADAANEGHIMIKLTNDGGRRVTIPKGKAFAQGVFQLYLITDDDRAETERVGGIGSTDGE